MSRRSSARTAGTRHHPDARLHRGRQTDVRSAARHDDLADALDYSAVAQTIAAVVREGRFRLIETAAERVAERLLADHPVAWLRLEVRKPIAGGGYTAAVTIERGVQAG